MLRRSRKRSPRATCTISINTVLFPNTPCGTIKRLMNCRRDRVSSVDKMPSFCATIPSRVRQSNRRYRCIEYCTFGWLALALSLPRGSLYRDTLFEGRRTSPSRRLIFDENDFTAPFSRNSRQSILELTNQFRNESMKLYFFTKNVVTNRFECLEYSQLFSFFFNLFVGKIFLKNWSMWNCKMWFVYKNIV